MSYAYKVLGPDRTPHHGGSGRWAQRKRWMPSIEHIAPCESGYHLCADETQLLFWLGPTIWIAEYEGAVIDHGDKIVVGRARLIDQVVAWDDRTARHFACDCAERVAHLNKDPRVMDAITTSRQFADGEIGMSEMAAAMAAARAAARAAAGAAAMAAARAAAGAAAGSAAGSAAMAAAWAAARAAARAAAGAAAGAAAWSAEREWQSQRFRGITGGLPS
jgi:hypothetical protein